MAIGNSTGTYVPYTGFNSINGDRSGVEHDRRGHVIYKVDLAYRKINEVEHIKWCRRNLGQRHDGWDFWLTGGILYIEVWGDKQKFTYELWKN